MNAKGYNKDRYSYSDEYQTAVSQAYHLVIDSIPEEIKDRVVPGEFVPHTNLEVFQSHHPFIREQERFKQTMQQFLNS